MAEYQTGGKRCQGAYNTCKINVSNLPPKVGYEDVRGYFESSKRTGGGPIRHIDHNEEARTAVIEFKSPDSVASVLARQSIRISGYDVDVKAYIECEDEPAKKILVSNIPKGVDKEMLEVFFESEKRTGGGPVAETEYDSRQRTAIIEFEEPKTVQSVLMFADTSAISFQGANLKVEIYSGTKDESVDSETGDIELPKKILVSNIPERVSKEDVEVYFENKRRTGGGPVADVELDSKRGTAVIEFENPNTVQSVLMFADTSAISFQGASLKVEIYSGTKDESVDSETGGIESPRKILASNIPERVSKEDVEVYFENKRRTGGGPVADVELDSKRGTAVIEFENPDTVQSVLMFADTSAISFQGANLKVEIYSGTKDESVDSETGGIELPRKILVSNIPERVSKEDVEVYFENKRRTGGGPVAGMELDSKRGTAVIEFENPDTVQSVLMFADTSAISFQGANLKVEIYSGTKDKSADSATGGIELPRKILVSNIPERVSKEDVEVYFENRKHTGGGPVADVELDSKRGTAVIEFENPDTVQSVLAFAFAEKSEIRLRGAKLEIKIYSEKSAKASEPATMVIIKNVPAGTTEEILEMFFETKSNGGILKTIEYNKDNCSAVIDFEDHQSVKCLLEKQPLTFRKTKVTVESYQPEPIVYDTISVRGTPTVVTKENMELYFESESRSGGGKIETIELHESDDENTAYIKFASEEVAKAVAERPHKLMKTPLNVILRDPTKAETGETDDDEMSEKQEDNTESQDEPKNTIKVKGLKGISSPDIVRFYFENKRRAGGGTILDFSINKDDGEALITFESDKVAKDVLDRSHKIEGRDLKVVQYRSPALRPYYQNKVLVTGVGSETTEDCLLMFLEAKSGIETTDVMFGEDSSCKLVTFNSEPDVEKLQNECNRTLLEYRRLSVRKVQVSNCIKVSGFSESVTAGMIELYFENGNRSGGGPVEKVDMRDGYCLVYFENYEDVNGVINKEHSLTNEKLDITLFHECLGEYQGDGYQPAFHCPNDLLTELEYDKLKFLLNSTKHRAYIEKKMTKHYASLAWPTDHDMDRKVIFKCLLTTDVANCCELSRSWHDKAKEVFCSLLDDIMVTKFNISNDIWPRISSFIREMNISDPTKVLLTLSKDDKTISVTGEKQTVEELAASIGQAIEKLEIDLELQKRTTVKHIPLDDLKLKAFMATNMKQTIEKRISGVSVSIDMENKEILITGTEENVSLAGMMTYECTNKYASRRVSVSPQTASLLLRKPVQEFLQQEMMKRDITAVWQTKKETVDLCVIQDGQLTEGINVLKECFCEEEIESDDSTTCVMQSDKWTRMINALEAGLMKKFVWYINEKNELRICCTADIKSDVICAIDRFFSINHILTETVELPTSVAKYLQKHEFRKLQSIAKLHKDDFVTVTVVKESRIVVSGNKDGVRIAKQKVEDLSKKVQSRRIKLNRPGLAVHLTTPEGKDILPDLEKTHSCIIETKTTKQKRVLSNVQTKESYVLEDGRTISLYIGDIANLPVDSVICAADKTLTLTAGVGKSIVTKGGVDVRNECIDFLKKNKELKEGKIMRTPPGTLECKHVFFINGPGWRAGEKSELKLEKVLIKAIENASRENSVSIALPAICCGRNGFPIDIGTRTVVGAIKAYFDKNPQGSIRQVYLVDISHVDHFSEAVKKIFRKANLLANQEPSGQSLREPDDCSQPTRAVNPVIVKGQLAKQQVDVIVNSTNNRLDLSQGAVSTSIMKAVGPMMKPYLDKEYPKGIKEGEVAFCEGYKLKCKEVFHVALCPVDNPNALQIMGKTMKECLLLAQRRGHSSIAFPSLGTGLLKYPAEDASKVMFDTVKQVSENKDLPEFKVKDIYFVIDENDKKISKVFDETSMRLKAKLAHGGEKSNSEEESDDDEEHCLYPIGDMVLEVKTGDLTKEHCDSIVNSTDVLLDLTRGAVAKSLLEHAGQELERELERKRSEMRKNKIVITDAYNLPCDKIIHVEAQQDVEQWKEMMLKCLKFADANNVSSIAFPAIGSGLGIQTEDMATIVFEALGEFQTNTQKKLKEVRFVLFNNKMFKEFCSIVDSALENKSQGIFGFFWSRLPNAVRPGNKTAKRVAIKRRKEDTVYCTIYAATDDVINDVMQKLYTLCDSMTYTKTISRDAIKKIDDSAKTEIERECRKWHVSVRIDTDDGTVQVDGMQTNTFNAVQQIYEYTLDLIR